MFIAGGLANCISFWESITDDSHVHNIIRGYKPLHFTREVCQHSSPPNIINKDAEIAHMNAEVESLLKMGVIEHCDPCDNQYVSNVFLVPKHDGSYRKILNLKTFNEFIPYEHFKMERLDTALELLYKDCFLASVDLKKAYYSVVMHQDFRKYLRFCWNGQLYQYTVLPNGLSSGPKVFTRIVKVLASELRKQGFENVFYLDDSLLIANTIDRCVANVNATISLLRQAGFTINFDKSVLEPTHRIQFLGFIIDSHDMKVYLPKEKVDRMTSLCLAMLKMDKVTIMSVSRLVGTMVAYLPAMKFGKLHYRALERDKIVGLRKHHGNFNSQISLSSRANQNIQWWLDNVNSSGCEIDKLEYDLEMFCDASREGYGCRLGHQTIGGRWSSEEIMTYDNNINALELLAIFYSLKSFDSILANKVILIRSDNTTAVCYVNEFGGQKSDICDSIARKIWDFCIEANMFVKAAHIKGSLNTEADKASRNFNDEIEHMIDRHVFSSIICKKFGKPTIDCFASRLNNQVPRYFSWKPDPFAEKIDAFTVDWSNLGLIYCFPPFRLLPRVLRKINQDKVTAIVIYPCWRGQPWWPRLAAMLLHSIEIPSICLQHPTTKESHSIRNLKLMAGLVKYIVL